MTEYHKIDSVYKRDPQNNFKTMLFGEYSHPEFKYQWGDFTAEGIVARPLTELKLRSGARIITKLKHSDFPTKYD